ncbi:MAG: hypothetical protein QM754_13025 [Tepidisphaeraceae bacterium]
MKKLILAAVAAIGLVGVTHAQAGVSVDIRVGSPPPPPCPPSTGAVVYGSTTEQVWVPEVRQTVVQNVWHEPVTEDRVSQVWVPDRYEPRDVTVKDQNGNWIVVKQQVVVEPGHYQDIHTPVIIRAGYWGPEAQSVVVSPGHWETVSRPVVVRTYSPPPAVIVEGRWSDRDRGPGPGRRDYDRRDYDRGRRY